jgi:hypothetical protein
MTEAIIEGAKDGVYVCVWVGGGMGGRYEIDNIRAKGEGVSLVWCVSRN